MGILSTSSAAVAGTIRPEAEEPATTEHRAVPRSDASLVPAITGLRFAPRGADARLLNISTTGLLAECGVQLRLGSAVPVLFEGAFSPKAVDGRVMRSSVVKLDKSGGLRYQVGIAFRQSIPLDSIREPGARTDPAPADTVAAPALVRNRW
jgi:hypothetical protein